jgi:hypothetical protein
LKPPAAKCVHRFNALVVTFEVVIHSFVDENGSVFD